MSFICQRQREIMPYLRQVTPTYCSIVDPGKHRVEELMFEPNVPLSARDYSCKIRNTRKVYKPLTIHQYVAHDNMSHITTMDKYNNDGAESYQ